MKILEYVRCILRKLLMVLTATLAVAVADEVVLEMDNGDLIVCDNGEL